MKTIRFVRSSQRWTHCAGVLTVLALWSGAALSLPDNPKDPPLPPSTMGELYGDSHSSHRARNSMVGCDDSTGTDQERKNAIRLQDGSAPNEGRVEICIDFPYDDAGPMWSKVCDDNWSDEDALVACRQLGHDPKNGGRLRAESFSSSHFGAGTVPYSLNNFLCSGSELYLRGCITAGGRNIGFDAQHCTDNDAAGVRCLLDTTSGDATLQNLYVQETATGDAITIESGTLNNPHEGFVSRLFGYFTVPEVPRAISEITIYATKTDAGATVEYYDSSSNLLGSGPSLAVQSLAVGWTEIGVQVTADDGTVRVYEVNIERD